MPPGGISQSSLRLHARAGAEAGPALKRAAVVIALTKAKPARARRSC
jgi:hypothetical protein